MHYDVEQRGPAWIVRFGGDMSSADDPDLRRCFVRLSQDNASRVVADMGKVSFLDSTILGTLLWGMKNLREAGG